MGFTGSIFSMRSTLVGRRFAQNGPPDQENQLFQSLWPILGPENGLVFSVRTAPIGGTRGQRRKKNHSVFDENTFFETATKNKIFGFFSIFWGSKFFCRLGPGISLSAQTPPKTSKSRFSRKTRVKPPNVVRVRKLRNANAVPMSQNTPEKSPLAPSYGQNGFLSVGSLTDRTSPQLTKWPPTPSKTAICRAPGTRGTPNSVHWVRI